MQDNILNIPDGRKEFFVNNDPNRVLRLNLTDDQLIPRIKKALDSLESYKEKVAETGDKYEIEELIDDYNREVRERLNEAFDYDVSSAVFQNMSVTAQVTDDGKTFIEVFLDAIMEKIVAAQKEYQKNMRASNERINKHVNKYRGKDDNNTAETT
jgi:hypothetical protein